jgi:hypothetical protein
MKNPWRYAWKDFAESTEIQRANCFGMMWTKTSWLYMPLIFLLLELVAAVWYFVIRPWKRRPRRRKKDFVPAELLGSYDPFGGPH